MHDASDNAHRHVSDNEQNRDETKSAKLTRPRFRGALIFGVIAATIEMAIVLWLAYC